MKGLLYFLCVSDRERLELGPLTLFMADGVFLANRSALTLTALGFAIVFVLSDQVLARLSAKKDVAEVRKLAEDARLESKKTREALTALAQQAPRPTRL
jgi:hypothetical protein